ncbi:MAG: hypothetical protein PHC97_01325 [Patescibacteria group bacterium]|nr:hypothetical protein [Patescibacteria group bacterium]
MAELTKISPDRIAGVDKEKLIILEDISDDIRKVLLSAEALEKAQLLEVDNPLKRREVLGDCLVKYQKGLDMIREQIRNNTRWKLPKESLANEEIYITERMDYLEGILHKLPKQVH